MGIDPDSTKPQEFNPKTDTLTRTTESNNISSSEPGQKTLKNEHTDPALLSIEDARRDRHILWLEIAAVICIGVAPDTLNAIDLLLMQNGEEPYYTQAPFWSSQFSLASRSIYVALPVLFIMLRSDIGLNGFGVSMPKWKDAGHGLAWTFLFSTASYIVSYCIWSIWWVIVEPSATLVSAPEDIESFWSTPNGVLGWISLITTDAMNGFAEELVVRAYLITRLLSILKNPLQAVLISSAAFGIYHLYYGVVDAAIITISGTVLGFAFVLTRSVWPVVIAHGLSNLILALDA